MTGRSDYTEAEWAVLSDLPRLAAFGAMAAEADGPVTSTRELWAAMQAMLQPGGTDQAGDPLIAEIVRGYAGSDHEGHVAGDWDPESGEELGQAIVAQALQTAPRARAALAARATPEEAEHYRHWVLGIARGGVEAARDGLFGLSGERVSAPEGTFIHELAAALGASSSPSSSSPP